MTSNSACLCGLHKTTWQFDFFTELLRARVRSADVCICHVSKARKAIPLQFWTGTEGSKRLRLPDFKTIGTWRWKGCQPYASPAFTPPPPRNIPGTHFCWRLSQPQGHIGAGRIMSMKNSNNIIGKRTRDLSACSAVPWGFQEVEAPRFKDNRHMKVVWLTVRRTGRFYSPRKYSWYSFLLVAASTPGPYSGRKDYVNEKFLRHHRESNPGPSGLQRSASTQCSTAYPVQGT